MRQRISVDLEKMALGKALRQLARETGTNLILDTRVAKDARTPVTLQMDGVPLETDVRLMAEKTSENHATPDVGVCSCYLGGFLAAGAVS